jgi:hypothetical protein
MFVAVLEKHISADRAAGHADRAGPGRAERGAERSRAEPKPNRAGRLAVAAQRSCALSNSPLCRRVPCARARSSRTLARAPAAAPARQTNAKTTRANGKQRARDELAQTNYNQLQKLVG